MSMIRFEVEINNDLNGQFLTFEYDYEVMDDMTEEELLDLADDLVAGRDSSLYDEVMGWIALNASIISIDKE